MKKILLALIFCTNAAWAQKAVLWSVEVNENQKTVQSTRFYTDRQAKSVPFMVLETEDNTVKDNIAQKQQTEQHFAITSSAGRLLRYTIFEYNLGVLGAQRQDKTSNVAAIGSEGKITFLHLCDKKSNVFSVDKYTFNVTCQEVTL